MSEKPKLEVVDEQLKAVDEQLKAEVNPISVFDDLASLRKVSKISVVRKAVLVNVAVDKPPKNSYFRCHPDLILDDATVLKDAEGTSQAFYFVVPAMRAYRQLAPRLRSVTLALTATWPSGGFLIWPVPVLGERELKAWKSARAAYELAREHWTQMVWNEALGDYQIEIAEKLEQEPVWPTETFEELLKRGFDGKVIDNPDHPYVRRLRGIPD